MTKRKNDCRHLLVGASHNEVRLPNGDIRIAVGAICVHCKHVFRLTNDLPIDVLMRVGEHDIARLEPLVMEMALCMTWFLIGRHQRHAAIDYRQVWPHAAGSGIVKP